MSKITTRKITVLPPVGYDGSLYDMITEYPIPDWNTVLLAHKKELDHLDKTLPPNYYPRKWDIFNALYYTPLNTVKVVIIGQDPYHSDYRDKDGSIKPVACGLAFSVRDHGTFMPPTILNIYKRLEDTVPDFQAPDNGDLTPWTKQGVLLLNTCLTVTPGKAGSHGKMWLTIIKPLLAHLVSKRPKTLFLLWGANARTVKSMIGNCKSLEASHPSPLSVSKSSPGIPAFEKCDHFNEVNNYLIANNMTPINWQL